jgi:hypothetical protein
MNLSQFPKLSHTEKRQEYPRVLILTTLKELRRCGKKMHLLKDPLKEKRQYLKELFMNIIQ